ncbi:hypothetical protein TRFO_14629 [Tritrichomonas foetus]|uniref:Uncharacterized protein n=1 Tax=Tritrichomonas foetus TaxID=1144522 RepID=A0A1J4KZ29_9EUKA|nr:hypothetical protein TRFO_14629 [Tritrichomonas foetus]|eukprot:OHT14966.1 hypothetical protein TRFO_14629 [Tritrichomonas foetus]
MKQRPFCDQRPSMQANPLLQKPKIGRTIRSTQDLPDDDYRYGKVYHDNFGVKELVSEWQQLRPTQNRKMPKKVHAHKQDFVATNKAALRAGCVTAKEYREFRLQHEINVRPEDNAGAEEDKYLHSVHQSMVHGIPTPVTSEMKDCLTYQCGRDAVERAKQKQTLRHMPTPTTIKRQTNHGIKQTRASRGHSVKRNVSPSKADNFKMKRFLAIDHCAIVDHW